MIGLVMFVASAFAVDVADPHGVPGACGACHPPRADTDLGPPSLHPATCRGCHPTADMHPVGVTATEATIPDGWPLLDGAVVCATCHADPSCGEGRMTQAPYWRGGPYDGARALCRQCHAPEGWARSDPHRPDLGTGTHDASCAACHRRAPTPTDTALREAPDDLCAVCHEGAVHLGVTDHVGQAPDPIPADLSLVDGRIACITCHDVHGSAHARLPASRLADALVERAVSREWRGFLPEDIRWPGREDTIHNGLLAGSLTHGGLCAACHGRGPE